MLTCLRHFHTNYLYRQSVYFKKSFSFPLSEGTTNEQKKNATPSRTLTIDSDLDRSTPSAIPSHFEPITHTSQVRISLTTTNDTLEHFDPRDTNKVSNSSMLALKKTGSLRSPLDISGQDESPRPLLTVRGVSLDVFPENVPKPAIKTELPRPRQRIERTDQLHPVSAELTPLVLH
ncbi:hypothetical protein BKA57DRAFT_440435 [Linnemannia elongata]|nr:hypothetical protein BKA57DRAFT_440435 [Linnemannia elongata]